ncbi:hypothetical protein I7I50_04271 [Histoplasma capsulatum G186AR]|uniref:Uncharacterized protein n=1 Tax=Ajellomyces capsulatus TaxID=5037 RepID=A0A8H7YPI6_AJECA|nr:hypothetical protein I7I52_05179 [Histoplasma capsulatum]QSS75209.1 hypothetical protein I7I50_04271 [Histoplasma capsulatum G186AR]
MLALKAFNYYTASKSRIVMLKCRHAPTFSRGFNFIGRQLLLCEWLRLELEMAILKRIANTMHLHQTSK